jgi:hypothetical protein
MWIFHCLDMMHEHAQFDDGTVSVEAGLMQMADQMRGGRWKVFKGQNDGWMEEFRLYHRDGDCRVVDETDDAISASRMTVAHDGYPIPPRIEIRQVSLHEVIRLHQRGRGRLYGPSEAVQREEAAWGEETVDSFETASELVAALAGEFSIAQACIKIEIRMHNHKHGTRH